MEPNACTNGSAEVGRKLKRGCAAHDALGSVKEGLFGRDRDGETFGRRAGLLGRTWMHEAMGCSPTECVLLSRQSQQCHTAASRQKRVQAEHQLGIHAIQVEAAS